MARIVLLLVMLAITGGCTSTPNNIQNACAIFEDKSSWYHYMKKSFKKWGVPIHVQLAIIHQESKFKEDAKPPRKKLFWFIPGARVSSAFGYAQALDGTWKNYQKSTGNHGADRDDFEDAVDFIGWYGYQSHRKLGISKWNAKAQYLAYHEGQGGYKKKSYLKKPWLVKVASRVERNAKKYRAQLAKCRDSLEGGWGIWPF